MMHFLRFFVVVSILLPSHILWAESDVYDPLPGHPTSQEKINFKNKLLPIAREAERVHGVPAAAIMAMAMNESGYGWTKIAQHANNFMGWKWTPKVGDHGYDYYTLEGQPASDPGNQYIIFGSLEKCIMYVAMKLASIPSYKQVTNIYVSDIQSGVYIKTAVDKWVVGIQNGGYNPNQEWITVTKLYLNDYYSPSTSFSTDNNLYQHSPVTGAVESVWLAIDNPAENESVGGTYPINVSTGGGTVTGVKMYTKSDEASSWYYLGEATAVPYSRNWATAPWVDNGNYQIKVEAYDGSSLRATGYRRVIVDNSDVVLSLDSPAEGDELSGDQAIRVSVVSGTVDTIEVLYRQAQQTTQDWDETWTSIGSDNTAPYSIVWDTDNEQVADDYYQLAVRSYHQGVVKASFVIGVVVQNAMLQDYFVDLTTPFYREVISEDVTISVTTEGHPNDDLDEIRFYSRAEGSTGDWYFITSDTTRPYSILWATNPWVPDGNYNLKVIGLKGGVEKATFTTLVTVANQDMSKPIVSITSPLDGAIVSGDVTFSANVSDDTGVEKVEFYSLEGNYLINTDTTVPYSINWATDGWVPNGFMQLKAKAYDTAGNSQVNSILVSVNNPGAGKIIADGVDAESYGFTSQGDSLWYADDHYYYADYDSARSGIITHHQDTSLKVTVPGPGTLSFYWRVSSEPLKDWCRFYIDGVLQDSIAGDTAWNYVSRSLTTGAHDISWKYEKDGATSANLDACWVDVIKVQ